MDGLGLGIASGGLRLSESQNRIRPQKIRSTLDDAEKLATPSWNDESRQITQPRKSLPLTKYWLPRR